MLASAFAFSKDSGVVKIAHKLRFLLLNLRVWNPELSTERRSIFNAPPNIARWIVEETDVNSQVALKTLLTAGNI
jgi:hypothetical protein